MVINSTIQAILFDFDGTLSQPGAIDYGQLRQAIACPPGDPILEFIDTICDAEARQTALTTLNQYELAAAANTRPDAAAEEIVTQLRQAGLKLGIITRNSRQAILRALENFNRLTLAHFDLLITRDEPIKPKPSGQGIHLAARKWNLAPQQILMVGDFSFDIQAGQNAGSPTVLLDRKNDPRLAMIKSDFRIESLLELKQVLEFTRPLTTGKLPNHILELFLKQFDYSDPSVLVNAGIGDDTAAVDVSKQQVVVLKSDPITFATDAISQYAVLVNANDIVTAGATPRWFLTTLLFPPATTALSIRHVMEELYETCKHWNITLCGGHTEISDAVRRPIVIGMMAGTVRRSDLIEKKNMRPGNKILLTKAISVEGTAIIAREFSQRLLSLGLTPEEINLGQSLLSQISIIPEAQLACKSKAATAIHDITEGGVATAMEELSIAGGHRLKVEMDKIPIFPLTQKIGTLLEIDPMGLIGSGSLLICCQEEACTELMEAISNAGIPVACIGEVIEAGKGITAYSNGREVVWPRFSVDEITRLFS